MMDSIKKYSENYQDSLAKGLESFFGVQKQLVDTTFSVYEKGLKFRKEGYTKSKHRIETVSTSLEKQIKEGHAKLKTLVDELSSKYLPDAKAKINQVETLVTGNLGKLTDQVKEVLTDNVDSNILKFFKKEKELVNKAKTSVNKGLNSAQSKVFSTLGIALVTKKAAAAKTQDGKKSVHVKTKTVN